MNCNISLLAFKANSWMFCLRRRDNTYTYTCNGLSKCSCLKELQGTDRNVRDVTALPGLPPYISVAFCRAGGCICSCSGFMWTWLSRLIDPSLRMTPVMYSLENHVSAFRLTPNLTMNFYDISLCNCRASTSAFRINHLMSFACS